MKFIKLMFIALIASVMTMGLAGWTAGGDDATEQDQEVSMQGDTSSAGEWEQPEGEWEHPEDDDDDDDDYGEW